MRPPARSLLGRARLPVEAPPLGADRYLELMRRDKKVVGGAMRFVLLRGARRRVVAQRRIARRKSAAVTRLTAHAWRRHGKTAPAGAVFAMRDRAAMRRRVTVRCR